MRKELKYGIAGVSLLLASIVGLNSYTVVDAGTTKVKTFLGEVDPIPLTEGLHFPVNPLAGFDVFDTRNAKYEVNGLNIPTQDRFNSTGNVTVLYRIDGEKTPFIKKNYGRASEYIDKTMRQHLRSIVRSEGRKLPDSRSLAQDNNVTVMQENTKARLVDAMGGTGIDIQEVLVQDIEFDPRIAKQILNTQKRIQNEEQKKSDERIAKTNAAIKKAEAKGEGDKKREQADAEAYRVKTEAAARKQAAIASAQGIAEAKKLKAGAEAEAIKMIADANIKLNKSLTDRILEKQRLDNEAILYSKSKGAVPTTIIGETDLRAIGVPVASAQ